MYNACWKKCLKLVNFGAASGGQWCHSVLCQSVSHAALLCDNGLTGWGLVKVRDSCTRWWSWFPYGKVDAECGYSIGTLFTFNVAFTKLLWPLVFVLSLSYICCCRVVVHGEVHIDKEKVSVVTLCCTECISLQSVFESVNSYAKAGVFWNKAFLFFV